MAQQQQLLFLFVSTLLTAAHAFSSGAGACPMGIAAPFHSIGAPMQTTLEEAGFTLELDGDLMVGETVTLTLSGERDFRGFLVRLDGDGELEVEDDDTSIVAAACGDVPGVVCVVCDHHLCVLCVCVVYETNVSLHFVDQEISLFRNTWVCNAKHEWSMNGSIHTCLPFINKLLSVCHLTTHFATLFP